MIKISVMYPNSTGVEFDMGYYLDTHIPLVEEKLGAACKGVQVEAGVAGAAPGSPGTYVCMGHLLFDSVETYQQAFAPRVEAIMGDVPNYTNVEPVVQVSEIKL